MANYGISKKKLSDTNQMFTKVIANERELLYISR